MRLIALVLFLPTLAFAQSFTISEEDPPRTCASGSTASSFLCTGDFCDNISIVCRRLQPTGGQSFWTRWVESDGHRLAACTDPQYGTVPNLDAFMTGIACRGGNCDDISLHCTRFPGLGIDRDRCVTTRHTDGNRAVAMPERAVIAAIECSGRHCDDKQITFCPVVPR